MTSQSKKNKGRISAEGCGGVRQSTHSRRLVVVALLYMAIFINIYIYGEHMFGLVLIYV